MFRKAWSSSDGKYSKEEEVIINDLEDVTDDMTPIIIHVTDFKSRGKIIKRYLSVYYLYTFCEDSINTEETRFVNILYVISGEHLDKIDIVKIEKL